MRAARRARAAGRREPPPRAPVSPLARLARDAVSQRAPLRPSRSSLRDEGVGRGVARRRAGRVFVRVWLDTCSPTRLLCQVFSDPSSPRRRVRSKIGNIMPYRRDARLMVVVGSTASRAGRALRPPPLSLSLSLSPRHTRSPSSPRFDRARRRRRPRAPPRWWHCDCARHARRAAGARSHSPPPDPEGGPYDHTERGGGASRGGDAMPCGCVGSLPNPAPALLRFLS